VIKLLNKMKEEGKTGHHLTYTSPDRVPLSSHRPTN
jgi:hypothetical protein